MAETSLKSGLPGNAFEPLSVEQDAQGISRPSLSYWQDAWRRLRDNSRAMWSLYLIIALLAFTIFGPLVWTQSSSTSDVDQISKPPFADRGATIVAPFEPWVPATIATSTDGFAVRTTPDHPGGAAGVGTYGHCNRWLPCVSQHLSHRA